MACADSALPTATVLSFGFRTPTHVLECTALYSHLDFRTVEDEGFRAQDEQGVPFLGRLNSHFGNGTHIFWGRNTHFGCIIPIFSVSIFKMTVQYRTCTGKATTEILNIDL